MTTPIATPAVPLSDATSVDATPAREGSPSASYHIDRWSQGYFAVGDQGHVIVQPDRNATRRIDLKKLVDELIERGLDLPLLIRFPDILRDRITQVHNAFADAIRDNEYKGEYRCVYPIKVNQQRHVVEEIIRFGKPYRFGVEAGSKPELLAVLAMVNDDDTPIICNGFKDDAYIESVILAAKMGKNIIPVVEKFSELELIVKYAKLHHVKPTIGLRVKLAAKGAGRWEHSTGPRSKFGLFISEVLDALKFLQDRDMGDCLGLLHFHLGSQVSNIRNIKSAVIELARIYVELQSLGAGLSMIDVGGGLGVDYHGSNTDGESSMNYSLQEYANDVVYHIKEICEQAEVPHPTIVSESGRAMVAYHSVLVFNILGTSGAGDLELPEAIAPADRESIPMPVLTLYDNLAAISVKNYVEYFHDAQLARDETVSLFNLGYCSLEHRGMAERAYLETCKRILEIVRQLDHVPEEFKEIESTLAETYFCNMSVFQSLPDSWAIDQLFPIMPIHRLNEEPTARAILGDITCDSDGKVDRFIDEHAEKRVLDLHDFKEGEGYYLAAFMVGAYQEILGDMHNLFGDTNAVHVSLDEEDQVHIDEVIEGDTVREVLEYVQFNAEDLMRAMRRGVERAVRKGRIALPEARMLLNAYESGLKGYTYLS